MKLILPHTALAAILGLALAGVPCTLKAQTTTPADTTAPAAASTTPGSPSAATASTKAKKTGYKGTVTSIDGTAGTVTISPSKKDPSKTETITVTATTKITKDKKPAALTDLAVGDTITGSYVKDAAGALEAATLRIKSATAAPATSAAAPAPAAPAAPAAPMTQ